MVMVLASLSKMARWPEMKRMRADVIAEIKTALDEAKVKARAYKYLTSERYNYRRALAAIAAYDQALTLFARGTEHQIPAMAVRAEMTLAVTDGRRDALASVADWMNTEENNR